MWCTSIHADKTCIYLTILKPKCIEESYCFIHRQPQAAMGMRCGNGSASVPAEEHVNTGQALSSASLVQSSDVTI